MFRTALLGAAVVAIATPALAQELTPLEIVQRHTASTDPDVIVADYADDAIVLQEGRAIQGKAAIRELFARMFAPPPTMPGGPESAAAGGGNPMGGMKVTRTWEEGDVGFMTWEAGPVKATEEFIVKNGKIQVQTVFMSRAEPQAN